MMEPGTELGTAPLPASRILIVEDELPVLDLLRRALGRKYQVFACSRGDEALQILEQETFSLVIADLWLPGVGGMEIVRTARQLDDPPAVIVITGGPSLNSAIDATNDGAAAYIVKPFDLAHVVSRVAKVLDQWNTGRYAGNLQRRIHRLLVLNRNSNLSGRGLGLEEVLEHTHRAAMELTGMDRAVILLLGKNSYSVYPPEEPLATWELDSQYGIGAQALANRGAVIASSAQREAPFRPDLKRLESESCAVLPLIPGDVPEGLLYTLNNRSADLSRDQVDILAVLAGEAAVSIKNAQLFSQLQHAYEQLQELDQLKDEFISLASHELRTPLHSIRGFVQLLLGDTIQDPATRQECLMRVDQQTEHLRRLVEELLDLSRIEAGRLVVEKAPMALGSVVRDVTANLKQMAKDKGVALELALPEFLPTIDADSLRMGQVFTNLVHNGIKFTAPPGEVKIVAERVNGEVIVRVADTGPGIPPDVLPRLFERFYQAGDPAARRVGMGIGLYISRRIVEAHGGRIWVSSELGQGSTFCVALPVPATEETGAQAE
jgi:signal transduction histidine kinase